MSEQDQKNRSETVVYFRRGGDRVVAVGCEGAEWVAVGCEGDDMPAEEQHGLKSGSYYLPPGFDVAGKTHEELEEASEEWEEAVATGQDWEPEEEGKMPPIASARIETREALERRLASEEALRTMQELRASNVGLSYFMRALADRIEADAAADAADNYNDSGFGATFAARVRALVDDLEGEGFGF